MRTNVHAPAATTIGSGGDGDDAGEGGTDDHVGLV